MATVYLADDLKHDRKVAVKVLRPELAAPSARTASPASLPVHEAVRLLVEITDALAFAHAQGVVASKTSDPFAYAWGPDGRHVFIVVPSDRAPFQTLWSVPLDGATPRPLLLFDDPYATFGRGAFAVQGSTIYFALLRPESDVWVADIGVR
jgi:hypothetical protein